MSGLSYGLCSGKHVNPHNHRFSALRGNTADSAARGYARDAFAAVAPLDQRFLTTTVRLATLLGVDGMSFFWSRYFFAYLDNPQSFAEATSAAVLDAGNKASYFAMEADRLSPTGQVYQRLIANCLA